MQRCVRKGADRHPRPRGRLPPRRPRHARAPRRRPHGGPGRTRRDRRRVGLGQDHRRPRAPRAAAAYRPRRRPARRRSPGSSSPARRERVARRIRGRVVGLVPQDPTVSLNPTQRIGHQVAEAVRLRGVPKPAVDAAVRRGARPQAGIDDPVARARQYPHELSGGLRQRVLIAIALAGDPDVIVADEPTSALDVTVQRRILDHLDALVRDRGIALVIITHDLGVAADRADRVLVLQDGLVVEEGVGGRGARQARPRLHEAAGGRRSRARLTATRRTREPDGERPCWCAGKASARTSRCRDGCGIRLAPRPGRRHPRGPRRPHARDRRRVGLRQDHPAAHRAGAGEADARGGALRRHGITALELARGSSAASPVPARAAEPVRLARPAVHDRPQHRRAARVVRSSARAPPAGAGRGTARPRRAAGGCRDPPPVRAVGRPAAAGRDRPRARDRARAAVSGRAGLGARRLGAGADAAAAGRLQTGPRRRLRARLARPRRRGAGRARGGGRAAADACSSRGRRPACSPIPPTNTRGRCWTPCPAEPSERQSHESLHRHRRGSPRGAPGRAMDDREGARRRSSRAGASYEAIAGAASGCGVPKATKWSRWTWSPRSRDAAPRSPTRSCSPSSRRMPSRPSPQIAWMPLADRAGVVADLPILTLQNGLASEDAALRRFDRVIGVSVGIPASHLEPGVVVSPAKPVVGVAWIGGYPTSLPGEEERHRGAFARARLRRTDRAGYRGRQAPQAHRQPPQRRRCLRRDDRAAGARRRGARGGGAPGLRLGRPRGRPASVGRAAHRGRGGARA